MRARPSGLAAPGEDVNMTPTDIPVYMAHVGASARAASMAMARAPLAARNGALRELARLLRDESESLQQVNRGDLDKATAAGLQSALVDRLKLTAPIIETVATGCEQIAAMADPIGEISELKRQPSGIQVGRMRVPLGVFAMVFESRPNVTIEAASLAIKSGNAAILRGGSEALASNVALGRLVERALASTGLPTDAYRCWPPPIAPPSGCCWRCTSRST
jgi:glutamate-5-semialdehyde dehydrogenase